MEVRFHQTFWMQKAEGDRVFQGRENGKKIPFIYLLNGRRLPHGWSVRESQIPYKKYRQVRQSITHVCVTKFVKLHFRLQLNTAHLLVSNFSCLLSISWSSCLETSVKSVFSAINVLYTVRFEFTSLSSHTLAHYKWPLLTLKRTR